MTGPSNKTDKPAKLSGAATSLDDGLDRSRKHKLWLSSNTIGLLAITAFVALAISRLTSDIRGEYTAKAGRLGVIRLSVEHRDGKIFADLTVPKTHPMHSTVDEKNLGDNVDWAFTDGYKPKAPPVVHFLGKAEPGVVKGVLQDGVNVYPINLERDGLASLFRQIRLFIPGAS